MASSLLSLFMRQYTRGNQNTNGKTLRPHTGLNNLLGRCLVPNNNACQRSDS